MAAALAAAMHGEAKWENTGSYDLFFRLGEGGIISLFGNTKVGKTKIATTISLDARAQGKSVVYFDLEHNLHSLTIATMLSAGVDYRYVRKIRDVREAIRNLEADFVVVDSATLHITGQYYEVRRTHERGNLLLELQNTMYRLNDWVADTKRLVLVIMQPVSEFGDKDLGPMGDKANFWSKEELYIKRHRKGLEVKKRELYVFDSRILPAGEKIAKFTTGPVGVRWEWVSDSLKEL